MRAIEVHFQRAAYAAILESHKVAVVFSADHTALLDKRCVDIYLAYIVDDNGEFDSFLVSEYMVEQSRFAASEITRKKQHRNIFLSHNGKSVGSV